MIRPFQPNDMPALLQIFQSNTPEFFHPSEAADYRNYLEEMIEHYWVFERENRILGAAGLNIKHFPRADKGGLVVTVAYLSWDLIHPDAQNQGIGSQLTRHRIDFLRRQTSIKTLIVRTSQLVYPFYEKQGFELEKTSSDYWAPGLDLYQLKMTL
ncbi:MAG: GNAT family N-acetyltransferase [Phaeodactylibacter sp.]|nr:GNAT family N-acetyltransferase [Phaeodactylibacter sp.]